MRNLSVLFVLITLLAFGCLGSESDFYGGIETEEYRTAMAPSSYADADYVIQESTITIKVAEGTLQSKFEEMDDMLRYRGAEVSDIRYNEYATRKQYTVTIRVAPTKFDTINDLLQEIGEVKDMSVQLEDVTQQYVDLDTRIKNRETELERLYELYNKSRDIEDLLAVEKEVTRVEIELEILKQQKQYLVSRIDRSTINITLYEEKPPTQHLIPTLEGLGAAFFGALGAAITLIVLAAGFLLPLAVVIGVLWLIYKKLRGGKKAKPRKSASSRIPPPQ